MPNAKGSRRSRRGYKVAAQEPPGPHGIPVRDPFATLPATARRVLKAARTILVERGYSSLTLDNIQRESGVNASAVSYYFGGKAGLVEALVDAAFYDECFRFTETIPREELVQRMLEGMQVISSHVESYVVLFELLPHAMRERLLHQRLIALYHWYNNAQLEWITSSADGFEKLSDEEALGLAAIFTAVIDGLGLQAAIDPQRFAVARPYVAFEAMLRAYLSAAGQETPAPQEEASRP